MKKKGRETFSQSYLEVQVSEGGGSKNHRLSEEGKDVRTDSNLSEKEGGRKEVLSHGFWRREDGEGNAFICAEGPR